MHSQHRPSADPGIFALSVFVTAALVVVGMVAIANAVDSWWVLVPVMLVVFGAAAGVMLLINWLLHQDDSPSP